LLSLDPRSARDASLIPGKPARAAKYPAAKAATSGDCGKSISFFIYFSFSLHLTPRGAEYITFVVDAPGAVTECVAAAMGGKKVTIKIQRR
jgi:hypothetical protein